MAFNINTFFGWEKGSNVMYTILNQGTLPIDFAAEKKIRRLNKVEENTSRYLWYMYSLSNFQGIT